MSEHLPECPHSDSRRVTSYGGYCVCPLLRACEKRTLKVVILKAELTFRSDVINPVRDVIEPLLDRNNSSDERTIVHGEEGS